jgi:acetamidase/formamidase
MSLISLGIHAVDVDLSQVHYLSGPIEVEGAEPGDLLKVEFLELGPLDGDEWGFTGTFAKENGGGERFTRTIMIHRRSRLPISYFAYQSPLCRIPH